MARPPDESSARQFNVTRYTESWAANNPYYATHVGWEFDTTDTTRTQAAIKSGVVRTAGYYNVRPEDRGISASSLYNQANPRHHSSVPYDRFGNVKKQRGDIQLGLVLMGGLQFPGQAFAPVQGKAGVFGPNYLARWMNSKMAGKQLSLSGMRARNQVRERGYTDFLSQSISSNKAPGGVGQSSRDTTQEMYSTQETRLGTRAIFTSEEIDKETGKYGRTWAGYRPLSAHAMNPHFDSKLGQMFKTENPNIGFARRSGDRRL